MNNLLLIGILAYFLVSCGEKTESEETNEFPAELVNFKPYKANPLFTGSGDSTTWDEKIRERGFILKEDSLYYMWYTGYTRKTGNNIKYLGLATSNDGISWKRHSDKPIHTSIWVEDVFVLKSDSTYYMFAESRGDTAHLLTSQDKVKWTDQGALDVRNKDGSPIEKGPYGTPTVWKENGIWYLFYERNDVAIWVATSTDLKVWTNVQDEPVIKTGPEKYDQFAVAMNQIIKYNGLYYAYYHASAFKDWREWSMNVAVSKDLIHWEKYQKNPILGNNLSSGILVNEGASYNLYTMHPEVNLHLPDSLKSN
ncbi:glycosylase [Dyadobacter sp. CY323]|uniref:glycosylase n=1 Tax=Dyadobacter sp. CY323 TaxID=2907302 RepID=UPI001F21124D|nr:glycosylase [Dyadobacter sp. CY323]MCE6990452.1 glycosylase [Dyadobacter sp. CY323]